MSRLGTPAPGRELIRALGALSDENRFRIVELLASGRELTCGDIAGALSLSPSLLTHHLGILEAAELIERRRDGLWTLNRLRRDILSEHLATLDRLVRRGD